MQCLTYKLIIMGKSIKMGNDEFILYCRKQHRGDDKSTAQLGKLIWEWIRDKADGKKVGKRENCEWGDEADNVSAAGLPYTATQFEFDRDKLPALYSYLDSL